MNRPPTDRPEIRIVTLDPVADYDRLMTFNRHYMADTWIADEKMFHWRTILAAESPRTATLVHAAVDDEDRILGRLIGLPSSVTVRGETVDITWAVDFYVSPELRGRGVGKKLTYSLIEQAPHVTVIGGTDMSVGLNRAIDMPIRNTIKSYTRVLSPLAYLRRSGSPLKRRWQRAVSGLVRRFRDAVTGRQDDRSLTFQEESAFLPAMERLVRDAAPPDSVVVLRDVDRVKWLCEKAPLAPCRFISVSDREGLAGYLILRMTRKDSGLLEGRILDIFGTGLDSELLARMIRHAVRVFRQEGVHVVRILAAHPNLKQALKKNGFLEQAGPFLINQTEIPHVRKDSDWHITMLDSDYSYR